jgi:hypothetical protein
VESAKGVIYIETFGMQILIGFEENTGKEEMRDLFS